MKVIKKYSSLLLIALLFLATSCEEKFNEINTNPNQPNETQGATPALLSQALRDIAFNDFDEWNGGRQAFVASQQWAQRNYTSEDRYAFRESVTDAFFRNNYIWMNNLEKIIKLNTDAATKDKMASLYGENKMQIAVANTVKAWVFQLLTDSFGDIPYSEALNYVANPSPKYDSQKDIYDALIATLKQAATDLGNSSAGFPSGDLFYKGDTDKWRKLANTLRLRLALRASNVDASYLAEAQSAINDGVLDSNADNAQVNFSTVGDPNEAPLYAAFYTDGRNDFTMTRQFVNLMKGLDDSNKSFVNPYNGIVDPRLAIYRGPSMSESRTGVPYGMPDADTKAFVKANSVISYSPALAQSDNSIIIRANYPSTFIDYPTVCFMKSEVLGWDANEFQKGIIASCDMWGVPAADRDAYVTAVMAKFASASPAQKKELVLTNKYIHLYTQPYEAWAEYRRTGYPKSLVKPGEITAVIGGVQKIFTPVTGKESGNDIVARFLYPTSEFTLNKTNVDAAATKIGGNSHKTRVWWAGGGSQEGIN
ncbi:MAG: SusD/RagB family nutrient-binding outer membrane lipoprotein [Bacteroidota bacterium]|nr:SusD/RagB family nutrient-binding outer membrane lipoprotein [Bacteroidota bacterium]MDP4206428.1 SusD/RagB family nutrient-binding outer membrane lipoprotein [Bacteroidota bacterium]